MALHTTSSPLNYALTCIIWLSLCLYRVKWVDIDGTMYKKPCALIIESENSEEDYPTFAKVLDIYIVYSKVFFELQKYTTLEFNSHFHCYEVNLSTTTLVVCHTELFSFYTHVVRLLPGHSGTFCIVPKHYYAL